MPRDELKMQYSSLCMLIIIACMVLSYAFGHEVQHKKMDSSVSTVVISESSLNPTQHHHNPDALTDENQVHIRCRICGASIALKKDYQEVHDTSKAIASKHEHLLGENGFLHTFINPSRREVEVAGFSSTKAEESDLYTNHASFFDGYNWRDLRCPACRLHVGWKFHHGSYQQCLDKKANEIVSEKAKTLLSGVNGVSKDSQRRAEIVRQVMDEKCVTEVNGWWTYQVCYKKEVRQYHEEPDGTRTSDWSMGKYLSEDTNSKANAVVLEENELYGGSGVIQYFAGGQHCDENGELRSTRVLYTCCKSNPTSVTIDNVEEPALCTYRIRVCIPALCTERSRGKKTLKEDLDAINQVCYKQFEKAHRDENLPATFSTLRWATVISENSDELKWAKNMALAV